MPLQLFLPPAANLSANPDAAMIIFYGGQTTVHDDFLGGLREDMIMMPFPLELAKDRQGVGNFSDASGLPASAQHLANRTQTWSIVRPPIVPAARVQHAATSGGDLYPHVMLVSGGNDQAATFASLWAFNVQTTRWLGVGPIPNPSTAIPGMPNVQYADVDLNYLLDYTTKQVDGIGCPWPGARSHHNLVTVGAFVWLLMGFSFDPFANDYVILGDVWRLDLNTSLLDQAMALQSSAIGGEYLHYNNTGCPLHWEQMTQSAASANLTRAVAGDTFPTNRYGFASAYFRNAIWVFGGILPATQFDDIWRLEGVDNPALNLKWTLVQSIQLPFGGNYNPVGRYEFGIMLVRGAAAGEPIQWLLNGGQTIEQTQAQPPTWLLTETQNASSGYDWTWTTWSSPGFHAYVPNWNGAAFANLPNSARMLMLSGQPSAGDANADVWLLDASKDVSQQFILQLAPTPASRYGPSALPQSLQRASSLNSFDPKQRTAFPQVIPKSAFPLDLADSGPSVPGPRWLTHLAAISDGELYLFSGSTPQPAKPIMDLWTYDLHRDWWVSKGTYDDAKQAGQPWPSPRLNPTVLAYPAAAKLYVIFGHVPVTGPNLDEIWDYDTASATWSNQTASMSSITPWSGDQQSAFDAGGIVRNGYLTPLGRAYCPGQQLEGTDSFVIFGGILISDADGPRSNDLWQGTWLAGGASIQWELLSPANYSSTSGLNPVVPPGRLYHVLGTWNASVVAIAFGIDLNSLPLTDCWLYHLETRQWSIQSTPMPFVWAATSVVAYDRWYIFGGINGTPTNALWSMSFTTGEWMELTGRAAQVSSSTPSGRGFVSSALLRSSERSYDMIIFGGESDSVLNDYHRLSIDVNFMEENPVQAHDSLCLLPLQPDVWHFPNGSRPTSSSFRWVTLANALAFNQYTRVGYSRYILCAGSKIPQRAAMLSLASNVYLTPITAPASFEGYAGNSELVVLDCGNTQCFTVAIAAGDLTSSVDFLNLQVQRGFSRVGTLQGGCFQISSSFVRMLGVGLQSCIADDIGGAINMRSSLLHLNHSQVSANFARRLGGGIASALSTIIIDSCKFGFNAINFLGSDATYTGGGAMVLYSTVAYIVNTTFLQNSGLDGGALAVLSPTSYVPSIRSLTGEVGSLEIYDCEFLENAAFLRGSAMFLSNIANATIGNTVFRSNIVAGQGVDINSTALSGTIYSQAGTLLLRNSTWTENSVTGGGAAVFWEPGQQDLSSNRIVPPVFEDLIWSNSHNNSASYGVLLASTAMSLALLDVSAQHIPQVSGSSVIFPFLLVAVIDQYNNTITSDDETYISVSPSSAFAGTSSVQVVNGVANFSQLVLLLPPKHRVNVTFAASPNPPRQKNDTLSGALTIMLRSASCTAGQYVGEHNLQCTDCAPGSFSTASNPTSCLACPVGRSQPLLGATTCVECGVGTFSGGEGLIDPVCPHCPAGQMSWTTGASSCEVCDVGMTCSDGDATALSGYWLLPVQNCTLNQTEHNSTCYETARSSFPCPWSYCEDGGCAANRLPAAINPLCAFCMDGFTEVQHACIACTSAVPGMVVLVVGILFLGVLAIHLFVSGGSSSGELTIFFYYLQVSLLVVGDVKPYLAWMHLFEGSVHSAFGNECIIPTTPSEKLAITLAMPFVLAATFVILIIIQRLTRPCMASSDAQESRTASDASKPVDVSERSVEVAAMGHSISVNSAPPTSSRPSLQGKSRGQPSFSQRLSGSSLARSSITSSLLSEEESYLSDADVYDSPDGPFAKMEEKTQSKSEPTSIVQSSKNFAAKPNLAYRLSVPLLLEKLSSPSLWSTEHCLRTMLALFMLTFQPISDSVLTHLDCTSDGFGHSVVFTDPTMDCSSGAYHRWLAIIVVVIIVWVVALPCAIAAYLWYHREDVKMVAASTSSAAEVSQAASESAKQCSADGLQSSPSPAVATSSLVENRWSPFFLAFVTTMCSPYHSHAFGWQLVIIVRRVVLSAVNTVFSGDAAARLCSFSLIHAALLLVHSSVRPFKHGWNDLMEKLSLASLLLLSVLLQWRISGVTAHVAQINPTSIEGAFEVVMCTVLLLPIVVMAGHWVYRKTIGLCRRCQKVEN